VAHWQKLTRHTDEMLMMMMMMMILLKPENTNKKQG